MSTVQEIQEVISQLPPSDLAEFRVRFTEFDEKIWDREFEDDVDAGRFEQLAEKARQDLREGRSADF